MEFELSEEQVLVQQTARDFAAAVVAPGAADLDRQEQFPRERWSGLAEVGFLGFVTSEELGGSAFGHAAMALALEELGRACASTAALVAVANAGVAGPIGAFGSDEQRARLLPALGAGERVGAPALGGGDPVDSTASCTAAAHGEGYLLDGVIRWVTGARAADVFLVSARLPAERTAVFVIDRETAGVRVEPVRGSLGLRGTEQAHLFLEGVEIPRERLVGREDEGDAVVEDTADALRTAFAAVSTGVVAACLADSRRYAGERLQFGKPIGSFEPIRGKLAGMAIDLELARLLTAKAAWLRDGGRPHRRESRTAKLVASEAACRCATDAVQIHGGAGYLKDFAVERYYRDAKVLEVREGRNELERLAIAAELLDT